MKGCSVWKTILKWRGEPDGPEYKEPEGRRRNRLRIGWLLEMRPRRSHDRRNPPHGWLGMRARTEEPNSHGAWEAGTAREIRSAKGRRMIKRSQKPIARGPVKRKRAGVRRG